MHNLTFIVYRGLWPLSVNWQTCRNQSPGLPDSNALYYIMPVCTEIKPSPFSKLSWLSRLWIKRLIARAPPPTANSWCFEPAPNKVTESNIDKKKQKETKGSLLSDPSKNQTWTSCQSAKVLHNSDTPLWSFSKLKYKKSSTAPQCALPMSVEKRKSVP